MASGFEGVECSSQEVLGAMATYLELDLQRLLCAGIRCKFLFGGPSSAVSLQRMLMWTSASVAGGPHLVLFCFVLFEGGWSGKAVVLAMVQSIISIHKVPSVAIFGCSF